MPPNVSMKLPAARCGVSCEILRSRTPPSPRLRRVLLAFIPVAQATGYSAKENKTTDYYALDHERCIIWDDPTIGILQPFDGTLILSGKDRQAIAFDLAERF
ncbi:MAG: dTDP-4-dehydrorhamnose 3,5-epimerase family protein, partial [Nitrospira sp.]|nr:dTDP-4-dehydrorhamnose 3,5-epimerase family protein [Nitrospira sp.]